MRRTAEFIVLLFLIGVSAFALVYANRKVVETTPPPLPVPPDFVTVSLQEDFHWNGATVGVIEHKSTGARFVIVWGYSDRQGGRSVAIAPLLRTEMKAEIQSPAEIPSR